MMISRPLARTLVAGKNLRRRRANSSLSPLFFLSSQGRTSRQGPDPPHHHHRFLSSTAGPETPIEMDSICELAASNLRYGPGSTTEVGQDIAEHFQCKQVALFTDANIRQLPCFQVVTESLERSHVAYTVYDQVRVEPNDGSFRDAIHFLQTVDYDSVIALGGGSVIDTAKCANLYACRRPKDFYDYVNPPTGKGMPIPAGGINNKPLPPLIAIPTTAGTGSETTGVAIFDDTPTQSKTGIANRQLKPALGILDPHNTATLPQSVATYSGLDVLCHAVESYTALPFDQRPKPASPTARPAYQGSNPISDVWSLYALQTAAVELPRAVILDGNVSPTDQAAAQSRMLLASAAAGMGFGNAGVHLCHGMSYPISSQVKESYRLPSLSSSSSSSSHNDDDNGAPYPTDHALIPHGLSVIVNAPAVFRWTGAASAATAASLERHARAARILQAARWQRENKTEQQSVVSSSQQDAGLWLADEIRDLCQTLQVPLGLRQFGYTEDDVPALVQGTIQQHRVTKISPRPVEREDLQDLFCAALDEEAY